MIMTTLKENTLQYIAQKTQVWIVVNTMFYMF